MPDRVPEDMPDKVPEDMPGRMPEDMPDRMPEDMPDKMSDRMPEGMPDKVPECLPEQMPEDLPDRMPGRMSEDMPEDMPDRVPEDMPEHIAEDMPGRMPEDMPDRMPEDMPERMPEDMSDRMPGDLPVTKRIDVMVGITRSKVIFPCSIRNVFFGIFWALGLKPTYYKQSLQTIPNSQIKIIDRCGCFRAVRYESVKPTSRSRRKPLVMTRLPFPSPTPEGSSAHLGRVCFGSNHQTTTAFRVKL